MVEASASHNLPFWVVFQFGNEPELRFCASFETVEAAQAYATLRNARNDYQYSVIPKPVPVLG